MDEGVSTPLSFEAEGSPEAESWEDEVKAWEAVDLGIEKAVENLKRDETERGMRQILTDVRQPESTLLTRLFPRVMTYVPIPRSGQAIEEPRDAGLYESKAAASVEKDKFGSGIRQLPHQWWGVMKDEQAHLSSVVSVWHLPVGTTESHVRKWFRSIDEPRSCKLKVYEGSCKAYVKLGSPDLAVQALALDKMKLTPSDFDDNVPPGVASGKKFAIRVQLRVHNTQQRPPSPIFPLD